MSRPDGIGCLSSGLRAELNRRLDAGETDSQLAAWLNSSPETAGCPVNGQDLAAWREGGHRDWRALQQAREHVRELVAETAELNPEGGKPLTDVLARFLAAQYGVATRAAARLAGGAALDLKTLRGLCADVVALRRGDHMAQNLGFEREWLTLAGRELDLKCQSKIDAGLDALREEIGRNEKARIAFGALRAAIKEGP